ncbi:flavodoxin [Thermophilibacter immobilis]|jgi:flavodoxin short chain|uniref:Flavodoxin n=1 Tax=Thermophilibacter immobilis TaxID=2779519 RepID=A0A7S7M9I8_9ACTN|nr:flavodoxin [Thermophilibacter immobilis]QOY61199.1 flavodoxin [Thermophilibacter immobilis]
MGKSVAIVYWTGTGNTEEMAQAFEAGVTEAGGTPKLVGVADFSAGEVSSYDALAFGCPAMGDEELESEEFEPVWDACKEVLGGRPVVLFGSYAWADGDWMVNWKENADAASVNVVATVTAFEAPDDDAQAALKAAAKTLVEA